MFVKCVVYTLLTCFLGLPETASPLRCLVCYSVPQDLEKALTRYLGTYDPIPKLPADGEGKPFKDIRLDSVRAKYWLGVGAQPSDPAWRLLSMVGLLEPKFRPGQAGASSRASSAQSAGGETETT